MSLLKLERYHSCPLLFYFHGQELKVIDHKGRPWFAAETIGQGLGLANPRRAVQKIFDRHNDEFGPDEVDYIEREIDVNLEESRPQNGDGIIGKQRAHTRKQKVIIFSLRGAYHLGFFAKTEQGKQFRQWVLDLIEARHEESSYYAAFRDVVGVLTDKYPLWQKVHFKLTIGMPLTHIASQLNIPVSRVARAVRQMRDYKVLTEKDYQRYRADSRVYLKIVNKVRKPMEANVMKGNVK